MRFFIVCPAQCASGGPELLHQFSQCLTNMGMENYMLYVSQTGIPQSVWPIPEVYLKYDVKYASAYIDAPDSVLVLAETWIHLSGLCQKGTVMVWWLSVNNYMEQYGISPNNYDAFGLKGRKNTIHAVQSYYAKEFLNNCLGIERVYRLSDYINDDIIQFSEKVRNKSSRNNICLYNPKKGFDTLQPIIKSCRKDIKWIPLIGYKPTEMAEVMASAKVYIDLGNHPGKDRIPREAAIAGCCVITNREGSATYSEDVPIPGKYKIKEKDNIDSVLTVIYDCIENYEERVDDFQSYRSKILYEKIEFQYDLENIVEIIKNSMNTREYLKKDFTEEVCASYTAIEKFLPKIQEVFLNSLQAYENGETNNAVRSLLNVDYMLSVARESIYAQLQNMLDTD